MGRALEGRHSGRNMLHSNDFANCGALSERECILCRRSRGDCAAPRLLQRCPSRIDNVQKRHSAGHLCETWVYIRGGTENATACVWSAAAAFGAWKTVKIRPENDGFASKESEGSQRDWRLGVQRDKSDKRDKSDNTTNGLIIGAIGIAIMPSFSLLRPSCLLRSIPFIAFIAFIPSCCLLCPSAYYALLPACYALSLLSFLFANFPKMAIIHLTNKIKGLFLILSKK